MSTKEAIKHLATATLVGTLLDDPKKKSDKAPADLVIGVTRKFKQGDEDKEATAKHHVKAWDGCADAAMKLRKGDEVKVIGELRTEVYEPEGGEKQFFTRVHAEGKAGGSVERL